MTDMREILFRGQHPYTGKWYYGKLTEIKKKYGHIEVGFYLSNGAGMPFAFLVSGRTIGQYTGLKDNNGVKIFEDDIIRYGDFGRMPEPDISIDKVRWINGCFRFNEGYIDFILDMDVEVIGNIHDNPELLSRE
jgi:uncharacterized phage protein (TIGR01671 family)